MFYDRVGEKIVVSHPFLEDVAKFLEEESTTVQKQEAIFFECGQRTEVLLAAFLWRSTRGQAHGGIRMYAYPTMSSFLRDGIRLSTSNGTKAALAGLWVGGGQGLIPALPERQRTQPEFREKLFFDYGDFLSGLNGCFVGSGDVGLHVHDVDNVRRRTRYVTGISEDLGGLGNPCFAVGRGVVCAMEAAIEFLNQGTIEDKVIAVQGGGNVGSVVISELLDRGARFVYATDCIQTHVYDLSDAMAEKGKGRFQMVKVPYDDKTILSRKCDILSPCAFGNVLNKSTVPAIRAKIVCGAANNQLFSDEDNQLLVDNGITYVVDYVANRMGMVMQDAEAYGRRAADAAILRHFSKDWDNSIFVMTKKILQKAQDDGVTPSTAANALAKELVERPHPTWPDRTKDVVRSLVDSGWKDGLDFWRRRSNFSSARNVW